MLAGLWNHPVTAPLGMDGWEGWRGPGAPWGERGVFGKREGSLGRGRGLVGSRLFTRRRTVGRRSAAGVDEAACGASLASHLACHRTRARPHALPHTKEQSYDSPHAAERKRATVLAAGRCGRPGKNGGRRAGRGVRACGVCGRLSHRRLGWRRGSVIAGRLGRERAPGRHVLDARGTWPDA